jgi:hypothetical protein
MTSKEINPDAMARFQSNPAVIDAHHALIALPSFQLAEDMALLYYNRLLASKIAESEKTQGSNSQQLAMINGFKLQGVQEYLHMFRLLGEKPIETQPPGKARTMNHAAQQ